MTPREYAKANREVGNAWEDGKTIQYNTDREYWQDYFGDLRPNFANRCIQWRIKPEPPQPKYRPFIHTEVPVGAEVRYKNNEQSVRFLIITNTETAMFGYNTHCSYNELLRDSEYKWPHEPETAWRPCGVEVAP
jgi:hypothetical protein